MILLDSSALLAFLDVDQQDHEVVSKTLRDYEGIGILSSFILAELDYMILTRVGQAAELAFLKEVSRGAYRLESFSEHDVKQAQEVIQKYGDLELGLADASLLVLADRHRTTDILTLDRRHFGVVSTPAGRHLNILPALL
ncbi:MAG: type II toxin-antitoxin system VapC family toxin [Candidatus Dormibacteraceae bacterium]